MVLEPQSRISERGLTVWRISGGIHSFFSLLLTGGVIALTIVFNWPMWIIAVALILFAIDMYLVIVLIPTMRWKRWRYEVRENEIELQHGVFVIKRTLVPMIRVQHVDTRQGPILRKYCLATVAISTAATVHEIPALDMDEAEELRFFISKLARVADEDV
ncbi:PH domain-containing protein [Bacillus sp. DTU_2020_1000418_1_SI_GHA_SEK_038]|uniref:PH domain-containing protein n=1 Tax=Bacillus sp. DTU_2020_1000418_1_SI_GHA_SEK_038 TaxID=3077585 RepID=UPI0028EA088B|nr:PH domain-containing protein [Bacillus sp. DTU_2020_1000418_1_SI_GHA_SEK_038]WNS75930.1 PH domain-containing protein [Bacillus sp. DTU_2020_1000418_1_SI_GHA_SEK_038]